MELIGKVLSNRYEILEEIGIGGMAFVYKAKCKLLNRNVAVKVLKAEYAKDENFVKRFKVEAQSAASLTHPNIVSVYDVGDEDGINYIVMELLESRTLKDYVEEKGALPNDEIIKISSQIASALEAAHKEHIIHRDIKPQNIVLSKNLTAKVTDFGIAKATTSATITNFGTTMGSVHYFSPEHAKGGYTDERSDIYSLGVVMYEMATGKVPFDSDSAISVALKHIQENPIEPKQLNSNISDELNDIILKAMAKNTVNRYKNATEILHDINDLLSIKKVPSTITAGETVLIPVITDDDLQENFVPNLRTRNVRRMNVVTAKSNNKKLDSEDIKDVNLENSELESDYKKVKVLNKKTIIYILIAAVILFLFTTFFVVKIASKIGSENKASVQYTVPNLVGRNYEDAAAEYKSQNIEIIQDKSEYSKDIGIGLIISQTPEKGTNSSDKKIYVVVSKGQKMVTVPDVVGDDIKVAKYELEDTLGFVIQSEEVVNDKVLAGIIISQEPKKDESLAFGSVIKLKVSKGDGKAKVIMPSVLDKTEADAKKSLTDLKLTTTVKYEEDKTKSNGVVLKQSYPVNQELKEGDLVELTVNKLLVTKTVSLDLKALQGGNISTASQIALKVTASVDGSANNTVFERSVDPNLNVVEFNLNGYKTASLTIYIDSKEVSKQTIDFTK